MSTVSPYQQRINRVVDHIDAHLFEELRLEELARVANFSAFHFHRIFRAMVGEPVGVYIARLRIEKAATLLDADPSRDISSLAIDVGFASPSTFARRFRAHFGMSASQWRALGPKERKIGKVRSNTGTPLSNAGKVQTSLRFYLDAQHNRPRWELGIEMSDIKLTSEIQIVDFEERNVAYVRHVGPYKGEVKVFEKLWGKILAWAGMNNLFQNPGYEALCVYHDNPNITEDEKLRISVAVVAPEETPLGPEMGRMKVPGGRYAVASFRLGPPEYQLAWEAVFKHYLPESGMVPDDRPCFELYPAPMPDENGRHEVRICVPVKPL